VSAYGVVLFHTSSAAFRAEKALRRHALTVKLIPTPRELSSDCGTALRFAWEEASRVRGFLAEARVEVAGIHPR
jgi:hypothetical protein